MNVLMRQDLQPLCQDCIILDGDMWLEFADGSKADTGSGVYNHHMTVGHYPWIVEKLLLTVTQQMTATNKPSKLLICPGQFNMPAGNTSPLLGTASDASKQVFIFHSSFR
jgi:hypothetical protein